MGKSAEELRAEAAAQRAALGQTADAIGDRVSPNRIMERQSNRMRDSAGRIRETFMGQATLAQERVGEASDSAGSRLSGATDLPHDMADRATSQAQGNPLAAGLVAFGAGLLVAAAFPGTKAEQRAAGSLKEAAQPLVAEAKQVGQEAAEHLKQPAQEAAEHVKDAATEGAASVQGTAQSKAQETTQAGKGAAAEVKSSAQGAGEHVRDEAQRS